MRYRLRLGWILLPLALLAAGCGRSSSGALEVVVIGSANGAFDSDIRGLSKAGQLVRAATTEGLVGLDANGQVIPALADRWIVTDGGQSFIFRLRDGTWPDGSELSGASASDALQRAIRGLRGTSLGLDLAQIDEIRAMAGRVVEIRLKGPMPDFLQLLAQPELGLVRRSQGDGPMSLRKASGLAVLAMLSPDQRGVPQAEDWEKGVREVRVAGRPAPTAVQAFYDGDVDVVLNGRIESLPLVDLGPLSRGNVRLDPASGLFGLVVQRADGFLADSVGREALAMAIDRDGLIAPFNIGGWAPTTRILPRDLPGDPGTVGERWTDLTADQRQKIARERVAGWRARNGGRPVALSLELPEGPGGDILLRQLAQDFAKIGVVLERAKPGERGTLALLDRVARYEDAAWYLNQFNCGLKRGLCSKDADAMVAQAITQQDAVERARLMAKAEAALTQLNGYIPFGQPVRWSLVRGAVTGYAQNRWVFHPLPELALVPR